MITLTVRVIAHVLWGFFSPPKIKSKAVLTSFRCWPLDIDTNFHMNNANYARIAELSRWRFLPASGAMRATFSNGWYFILASQSMQFYKPILPFQRYAVSTTLTVTEDKWLEYTHTFQQDDATTSSDPTIYCVIKCRAVMKERTGKTVKMSTVMQLCPQMQELLP